MHNFENKTVMVTGAGSGIGQASATLFAASGARVGLLDINPTAGEATAAAITDEGGTALFVQTDVTKSNQVQDAIEQVVENLGPLDAMVNVVGASGRKWGDGPTHTCTEEGWDWVMDVNLKSMFLCCKYGLLEMLKQGRGAIVNVASVLGMVGGDTDFGTHAYATSKGAVISLTRSIASYYAPQHIRANVVCPSLIATAMSTRAQADEALKARLPELQPLTSDFGRPEDVAHAALYLASDAASFVTGAVLTVDGGWTVR